MDELMKLSDLKITREGLKRAPGREEFAALPCECLRSASHCATATTEFA